jgi:hypothetical protein
MWARREGRLWMWWCSGVRPYLMGFIDLFRERAYFLVYFGSPDNVRRCEFGDIGGSRSRMQDAVLVVRV